jgi:hypothetical protein
LSMLLSQKEFADKIGASKQAVYKAIKNGRLSKSVVIKNDRPFIDEVEGILEWHNNADLRKDRGDHNIPESSTPTGTSSEDIKSISDSSKIDSHYSALIRKVLYLKETGQLMAAEKFIQEAFQASRTARDSVLYAPQKVSGDIRLLLMELVKNTAEVEELNDFQHQRIDNAVTTIRSLIKSEMIRSMTEISKENLRKKI